MNIEFLATVAVIAPDPIASRSLYIGALGLPLQGEGDGYYHSEQVAGCKSFGIWPLFSGGSGVLRNRPVARGSRVPQVSIEFDVPTPLRSLRRHKTSNTRAMSYCMELVRSHGARRSRGCSRPKARSSASPTRRCCTTDADF